MIYIGIDGDDIGRKLEICFFNNNEKLIQEISKSVENALNNISKFLQKKKMQIIFCSGDSLLCKGNEFNFRDLLDFIISNNDISFSAGIGNTMFQTYAALKYAKITGKNRIVFAKNNEYIVYKNEI